METGFPTLADVSLQYRLVKERCDRYCPRVAYTRLDKDLSIYDEVHDEVVEGEKVFDDAIELRAYVVPAEQALPLTVFGIEELRDVVLQVSVPNLIAAGLAEQDESTLAVLLLAAAGDRFIFTGYEYSCLTWKIGQTFANTDVPIFFLANCEKVRRDAAPYEGL